MAFCVSHFRSSAAPSIETDDTLAGLVTDLMKIRAAPVSLNGRIRQENALLE